jgi:serine phosphatase RsbU (regulator of sigma subunit)
VNQQPAAAKRRIFSFGAKLAAGTSSVLLVLSAILFLELSAREHTRLIASKTRAATMVTQLMASTLSATLDFADTDDAARQLNHLHSNADIVGATVWLGAAEAPMAQWTSSGAPVPVAALPDEPDGATSSLDWLVVTQTIVGRDRPIGRLRVTFTLRPDNDTFAASRQRLLWTTVVLATLTAAVLSLLARRYVVRPLSVLSTAALSLAKGDPAAHISLVRDDEIGDLTRAFNAMSKAVVTRQQRLQEEMDLAQHIQTALLPRNLQVPALDIDATMLPATNVGGDYYDVLPMAEGCWIGIGDVAGHGLNAGLVMLMMQSMIAALVRRDPTTRPRDVLCTMNQCLFDNIRNRLQRDDHATLTLLRYDQSGHVTFAGAHEEILVYRAEENRCETIQTPGTWVGGRLDIQRGTVDCTLQLRRGDLMLLYTDGVTELRNAEGEAFGLDRLSAELQRLHAEPVAGIKSCILDMLRAWSNSPDDDVTLLVARYAGESASELAKS